MHNFIIYSTVAICAMYIYFYLISAGTVSKSADIPIKNTIDDIIDNVFEQELSEDEIQLLIQFIINYLQNKHDDDVSLTSLSKAVKISIVEKNTFTLTGFYYFKKSNITKLLKIVVSNLSIKPQCFIIHSVDTVTPINSEDSSSSFENVTNSTVLTPYSKRVIQSAYDFGSTQNYTSNNFITLHRL